MYRILIVLFELLILTISKINHQDRIILYSLRKSLAKIDETSLNKNLWLIFYLICKPVYSGYYL
ncbi:MAG: hypothetical protein EA391_07760 [Balneolaceae bacterium]|nr:MAG: hypothetical protein EA391_07760 [Balneolaceae bacterium]